MKPINILNKLNESEEIKRDLNIEPGSDEEEMLNSLYDETPSATEEYWDALEIKRDGFTSLMKFNFGKDANGNNFIITVDNNEAERFYAESIHDAELYYDKWKEEKNSGLVDYDFNNKYSKIGDE